MHPPYLANHVHGDHPLHSLAAQNSRVGKTPGSVLGRHHTKKWLSFRSASTAFYESPQWQRSPDALRDHLTSEEVDASRDAVARFVGLEAYEQAGGGVRRDLFADEHNGIFLTDGALLDALARDKLV
ncbi:MAG: hypothetical protein ACRCVM_16475, partial [Giesbergeria sp.]